MEILLAFDAQRRDGWEEKLRTHAEMPETLLIEPFPLAAMTLPLAAYFGLQAMLRFSGQTLVTTGSREFLTLSFAVSGFVLLGPAELFFPAGAQAAYGPVVWIAIAVLYLLVVCMIAISSKPYLAIYGQSDLASLPHVAAAAHALDENATVDSDRLQIDLPTLRIRIKVESLNSHFYTRVESFESVPPGAFWGQLLAQLRKQDFGASHPQVTSHPRIQERSAWWLAATALLLLFVVGAVAAGQPEQMLSGFREWFYRAP
ncbi:MAG: hypothetical protein AAF664_10925 [Planctomycetota bacterium]